ncbi:MAG: L,D-transpeptidase [Anaerolineales bacterium]|nr:L,D-transpeptidase [Anaerolineales bacterium]
MKNHRKYWMLLLACALAVGFIPAGKAKAATYQPDGSFYDSPLCLPALYANPPDDCLPLGASQTLQRLAAEGIPHILDELPAASPDYSLTQLPVWVAKIEAGSTEAVPVYGSLDDARNGGTPLRTLAAGPMRYVSMVNQVSDGNRVLVQLESGEWMQAQPIYSWTRFQGLRFSRTPKNEFGWIVNDAESYTAPGYASPKTGKVHAKYEVIQIYQVAEADDYEWYRINEEEWVSSHKARRVVVDTNPPEGVTGDRWINIDLGHYTLSVYDGGELVYAGLIATGLQPYYTQPGTFQIYKMYDTVTMQDAYEADRSDYYHLQAVPWAIFYDRNTAIHGVYWPVVLGFNQSHGCVNMSPGDANWIYHWAKNGDWVYVHDPSGNTPTDPAYYGGVSTGP